MKDDKSTLQFTLLNCMYLESNKNTFRKIIFMLCYQTTGKTFAKEQTP